MRKGNLHNLLRQLAAPRGDDLRGGVGRIGIAGYRNRRRTRGRVFDRGGRWRMIPIL